jgi:antitoxin VapB
MSTISQSDTKGTCIADEIRIRPAHRALGEVLKKFAEFRPDFMAVGRGEQEQAERERV